MNTTKKYEKKEKVELHGTLAEFRQALEDEIEAVKKRGQSSTMLSGGVQISNQAGKFCYKYNADYVPVMPADTPCKLIVGQEQYTVTTVSFDEETITLASELPLPAGFSQARLENGSTVLMECMIQCIEENAGKDNPAGRRMLSIDHQGIVPFQRIESYDRNGLSDKNNEKQNEAIISALTNNITYIWGPPGTGKTSVIGQIIDKLRERNRSVLVVSHTNTAVDGAVEKDATSYDDFLEKHSGEKEPYPILRIGKPVKQLPDKTTLEFHMKMNGQELYQQKIDLEDKKSKIQGAVNEVKRKQRQLEWVENSRLPAISEALSELEKTKNRLVKLKERGETLQRDVDEEKENHPEADQYVVLSSLLEKANQHCDDIEQQLSAAYETAQLAPNQIQLAKDEIKKHTIYAELQKKESKTFSSVFIHREIESANEEIQKLQIEIGTLKRERSTYQQTISDYEKKGSIGRIFAGKSGVNQARVKLDEIDAKLPGLQENLDEVLRLAERYQVQLRDRLDLENQLQRLKPKQPREYWELRIEHLTQKLNYAKSTIPNLETEKSAASVKRDELQMQVFAAQKAYDQLQALEETLRQIQSAYRNAKSKKLQIESYIKDAIEHEHGICKACMDEKIDIEEKDFIEQHRILKSYFLMVSEQIRGENEESLEKQHTRLNEQLTEVFKKLREIEESVGELEKQSIMQAKVIGATLTKAYLSAVLRERTFDTVILDEASMAAVPALWCASYLAERNIVIVGDFLQLPPIVIADTPMAKKWLGRDIFDHSGMQRKAKKDSPVAPPENFVMLNEQYRMEPEIAEIANRYYDEYKELESKVDSELRQTERNTVESWFPAHPKHNVQLIDTESLHAWVTGIPQGKGHSRLNCFSAAVAVNLAFKCIEQKLDAYIENPKKLPEKPLVLIIAPYKPHIALINKLIRGEYVRRGLINKDSEDSADKDDLNFIRAGTIHSFQGSEADIVIFDLVIDEPHWKANLFMNNFQDSKTGEEVQINDDLKKMFNVAVTRAKFQLFIIGDFKYCQERTKTSKNELHSLLNFLIDVKKFKKQDAKSLFPELTYTPPTFRQVESIDPYQMLICTEASFEGYFMQELETFQNRMIIYSAFMTENRLSRLLPAFMDAVSQGKEIVIVTKELSERGKMERSAYEACERALHNCGDRVKIIHKHGMHEKLILVDDKVAWIGSLNALSFTGKTGEVMERRCSKKLVKEYEKMYDISHISQALNSGYELNCPICGGEMLVRESDDGGIYWQCVNQDYSRSAEQPYPKDGILRCRCGAEYEFSMKKEPRWVCTANPRHHQKIRESDLKLEKMKALIPKKELKAVEKYFSERRKEREQKSVKKPGKTSSDQQITLF